MRVGPPEYLLVPAEKKEQGSVFPDSLDHFKCYPVIEGTGTPVDSFVDLEDQFGYEYVEVKKPVYFCNPVSKNGEGIIDSLNHLVFYEITPREEYFLDIYAED